MRSVGCGDQTKVIWSLHPDKEVRALGGFQDAYWSIFPSFASSSLHDMHGCRQETII